MVFKASESYLPIYPQFVEITQKHERVHWGEWEVKLDSDVEDWRLDRLSKQEKTFISSVLRLFTQSDVAVAGDYYDNLIPVIKNNEARNMLGSFAAREGTHQRSYALLNDTLGKGEAFYLEFNKFREMKEKIEWMMNVKNDSPRNVALGIAKQVMGEGVMLFGIFALLLNLQRRGLLLGMGDVNQWSIRDESIHVEGLGALFHVIVAENPEIVDDAFKAEIYEMAREVVKLEDAYIDLIFSDGSSEGVSAEDTKQYVRAMCDYRMTQLGFKEQFGAKNPYTWLSWLLSGNTIENFFENNTAGYSKDSMEGTYTGGY